MHLNPEVILSSTLATRRPICVLQALPTRLRVPCGLGAREMWRSVLILKLSQVGAGRAPNTPFPQSRIPASQRKIL